jgi:hypothetical protein
MTAEPLKMYSVYSVLCSLQSFILSVVVGRVSQSLAYELSASGHEAVDSVVIPVIPVIAASWMDSGRSIWSKDAVRPDDATTISVWATHERPIISRTACAKEAKNDTISPYQVVCGRGVAGRRTAQNENGQLFVCCCRSHGNELCRPRKCSCCWNNPTD